MRLIVPCGFIVFMLLGFLKLILHLAITSHYVVQIMFFLRNLDRCHKNMMNWNRKKTPIKPFIETRGFINEHYKHI